MFDNCVLFNGIASEYGKYASQCKHSVRQAIETMRTTGKVGASNIAPASMAGRGRGRGRGRPPGSALKPKAEPVEGEVGEGAERKGEPSTTPTVPVRSPFSPSSLPLLSGVSCC